MKKKILVTNDDGLSSPGLEMLVAELDRAGYDLRVAAPEKEQSGVGHCITIHWPLYAVAVKLPEPIAHIPAFAVAGSPADCVKLSLTTLFPDFVPDLVVSGINRGPNIGVNVLYSGTVAGAMEACINGFPAVALSLSIPENGLWHFALSAEMAMNYIRQALEKGLPPWTALNINFPNVPREKIMGGKITKHGKSGFKEYYVEEKEENGRRRFRLEGTVVYREDTDEYDGVALRNGWVTLTMLGLDWESGNTVLADWAI